MSLVLTAQDIIDQALSLIGVLGTGSTIEPEEYDRCLKTMNLMIDRWNLTDLLVFSANPHTFALTSGQQSYNLGPAGDFDMGRPSFIEKVSIIVPNSDGLEMELPIDATTDMEEWQNIVVKGTQGGFPLVMWNNTGFPYMELNFWPIPTVDCSVRLYTWDQMPYITHLVDNVELPTGYADAIIYNLAVRCCQLFDRTPTPDLRAEAKQAMHDINDINAGTPTQHIDPMWGGSNHSGSLAARTWGKTVL